METNFRIVISSDLEYEELCAEIYYGEQFVAILLQENGVENMEIEIHPPSNNEVWMFRFSEFLAILEKAQSTLKEMHKLSEPNTEE